MDDGTEEAKIGAKVVVDAGLAFENIIELIKGVTNQVMEISQAGGQVLVGSQEIVAGVQGQAALLKMLLSKRKLSRQQQRNKQHQWKKLQRQVALFTYMAEELQDALCKFKV